MSSNIRLKKICQHCNSVFVARTTITKFCSDECAKLNYKKRQRDLKMAKAIDISMDEAKQLLDPTPINNESVLEMLPRDLIGIKDLSIITSLSERTLFRLMKEKEFPRLKIGRRVVFKRNEVVHYLTVKYSTI